MKAEVSNQPVQENSYFHCLAAWHMARMKSKLAMPLYDFSLRLSQDSGLFYCSALRLADFFGCSESTVRRTHDELEKSGFWILRQQGYYEPNVYHPVSHDDWAMAHPGRCPTKATFPWTPENDKMGQQLYAITGGRIQFKPYHIIVLRNLGLSEEELVFHFKQWFPKQCHAPRYVVGQFIKHLKAIKMEAAGALAAVT